MTLDPRIRKTVVLCRCGADRFVCAADVRRQIAMRPPDLAEWVLVAADGSIKGRTSSKAKAKAWTTAELLP
jgi:hypothetical protein